MARLSGETKPEDIHRLLEIFAKSPFRAKDSDRVSESILQRCLDLIGRDYEYSIISNTNGDLCGTYPTKLALLEYEKSEEDVSNQTTKGMQSFYDMTKLNETLKQARRARCRARCVIPVILYKGKHICRSATLSSGAEIYGRSGFEFLFANQDSFGTPPQAGTSQEIQSDMQVFDKVRGQDIQLLKTLNVRYICDLMVEKKKVKFLMNITSSEKVDKEQRYNDFDIFSVPYPGCEFFREWKDSGYSTDRVLFDWNQGYVDASLEIPPSSLLDSLSIDWKKYKAWDLLTLTRNYLRLLLHLLHKGEQGLLVHCISGWDRTPMFISLLRLSLWADGLIHKSLSSTEVLYLTIAYDWYLFGHNLTDRLQKGEEIMYFCFHFLKFISSDEFSLKSKSPPFQRKDSRASNLSESEGPVDGVLIDRDTPPPLHHRGSNSSLNSGGSNVPESDTVPSTNQQTAVMNGSVHLSTQRLPGGQDYSAHYSPTASPSSPMAVPHRVRVLTHEVTQSPVSGRCSEAREDEVSDRWQRLTDVWRLFSNAYAHKISVRYGTESTGLGTLLDTFAGKIGIRNNPV